MKNFELYQPVTLEEATRLVAEGGRPLAGGQDLLSELKDYLIQPERVVNLKGIPGLDKIQLDAKTLSLGALVKLHEVEDHAEIRQRFPALAQAAGSVASPQIRNLGTVGGNLCQRPRCWYYRDEHMVCLKKGGSECFAAHEGAENKYNAILGGGPSYIVHPSDLAPALVCLGATFSLTGPGGKQRQVAAGEFFTLPNQGSILRENVLGPGELVTHVTVPVSALAAHSTYLKLRERDSLDFALASVAMAVELKAGRVSQARVVLGGVAPIPWRAAAAEKALIGQPLASALEAAAQAATQGAKPLSQNAYKVTLAQTAVRRAGQHLAGGKA